MRRTILCATLTLFCAAPLARATNFAVLLGSSEAISTHPGARAATSASGRKRAAVVMHFRAGVNYTA